MQEFGFNHKFRKSDFTQSRQVHAKAQKKFFLKSFAPLRLGFAPLREIS